MKAASVLHNHTSAYRCCPAWRLISNSTPVCVYSQCAADCLCCQYAFSLVRGLTCDSTQSSVYVTADIICTHQCWRAQWLHTDFGHILGNYLPVWSTGAWRVKRIHRSRVRHYCQEPSAVLSILGLLQIKVESLSIILKVAWWKKTETSG